MRLSTPLQRTAGARISSQPAWRPFSGARCARPVRLRVAAVRSDGPKRPVARGPLVPRIKAFAPIEIDQQPHGCNAEPEEQHSVEDAAAEQNRGKRQRGILLLNLLVIICGVNWVVLKQSESVLDPGVFCIFRFLIAAAAFWPFFKRVDADIYKAGVEIGFWAAIGYLAQAEGLLTTDASHASFISTLTVLVVPILAGLSGKGVKALTWVSAVAAFIGVGFLEDGFSVPCNGDLWQLLSAVAFGVQIFRTEHHSTRLKEGSALPLMAVVVATIAAASIGLTAAEHIPETLNWLQHPDQLLSQISMPSWAQVLPVVWSALMSTDLVLLIEILALHDVSSTDASIIYTMEPVLGAGFAYVMLGERWGPLGWVGAALIVSSSLITQLPNLLPSKKKSKSSAQ